jgi:hypothetical protein
MVSHNKILGAMEKRYDHQSARTMTREALAAAGMQEKSSYEPAEIEAFVEGLVKIGNRVETVAEQLRAMVAPQQDKAPEPPAPAPAREDDSEGEGKKSKKK